MSDQAYLNASYHTVKDQLDNAKGSDMPRASPQKKN